MGVSLSVTDLFKVLLERHNKNRDATIRYMEAVVSSAKELADVWSSTYRQLVQSESVTIVPDGIMAWNISPYSRLEEFYRTASRVLGGNPELNNSFVEGIAQLLMKRKLTREEYQRLIINADRAKFVDDMNHTARLDDLRAGVEALHREAAALEVLLERFRAIGR